MVKPFSYSQACLAAWGLCTRRKDCASSAPDLRSTGCSSDCLGDPRGGSRPSNGPPSA